MKKSVTLAACVAVAALAVVPAYQPLAKAPHPPQRPAAGQTPMGAKRLTGTGTPASPGADAGRNQLTATEKKDGWKLLFDGKTPAGWRSVKGPTFPAQGWQIKDGVLTVLSSEGKESANGGDIITTGQYKAFDLSFQFKLTPGANSGVKYFVTLAEKTQGSAIGLEYQVLDDVRHPDAKLGRDGNRTLSSLYDLITSSKTPACMHPIGEWNLGRVVVYPDNRVEHYLNGTRVVAYTRGSKEFRDLVASSKYKVWPNFGEAPTGHILLQDHGNEVSFHSIKIKELK